MLIMQGAALKSLLIILYKIYKSYFQKWQSLDSDNLLVKNTSWNVWVKWTLWLFYPLHGRILTFSCTENL